MDHKSPAAATVTKPSSASASASATAVTPAQPAGVQALMKGAEAMLERWKHGASNWHSLPESKQRMTARAFDFLGIFYRTVLHSEMSAPCPLPPHNPSYYGVMSQPFPTQADPMRKEHKGILMHMLRPLGARIRIRVPAGATVSQDFINAVAAEEVKHRRVCTPRPPFTGALWLNNIENYAQYDTSVTAHWKDVLGSEWCIERPDLSFIFGTTRNPVTPLIAFRSNDPACHPKKIYRQHLNIETRVAYLLYVTLQFWLAANKRWAVETKLNSKEFQHHHFFAINENDISDDQDPYTGRKGSEALLNANPYDLKREMPRSLAVQLSQLPDPQKIVLMRAHELACRAKRLTFGRFYGLIWEKLNLSEEDRKEHALNDLDAHRFVETLKKNMWNQLPSAGFTILRLENDFEHYQPAIQLASQMLQRVGYHKDKSGARQFRTVSDSDTIKSQTVSAMCRILKPLIPSSTEKRAYSIRRETDIPTPPDFYVHLFFSPNEPVCVWPTDAPIPQPPPQVAPAPSLTVAVASQSSAMLTTTFVAAPLTGFEQSDKADATFENHEKFTNFYWSLVNYLNKEDKNKFDAYVTTNGFIVSAAHDSHANASSYFLHAANEPSFVRRGGARLRYAVYNLQNCMLDSFAIPDRIEPTAVSDDTVPTKFKAQAQNAVSLSGSKRKRRVKQESGGNQIASTDTDPFPASAHMSVHDPRMQTVAVLRHYFRLMRFDADRQKLIVDTSNVLATYINVSRKTVILHYVYNDLASRFSEAETWMILIFAEKMTRGMATLEQLAEEKETATSLLNLSVLWSHGLSLLEASKRTAVAMATRLFQRNSETSQSDHKVLRFVRMAFERDQKTYSPAHTTILTANREFNRQFFTVERVVDLLNVVKFRVYATAKKGAEKAGPVPINLDSQRTLVNDIVTCIGRDATLSSVYDKTKIAFALLDSTNPVLFCRCQTGLEFYDEPRKGYEIVDHIVRLWVHFVKHPIFFFSAYVTNPPCGALLHGRETEWVTMSSGTKRSKLTSTPLTAAAPASALFAKPEKDNKNGDAPVIKVKREKKGDNDKDEAEELDDAIINPLPSIKYSDEAYAGHSQFLRVAHKVFNCVTGTLKKDHILNCAPNLLQLSNYTGPHSKPFYLTVFFCMAGAIPHLSDERKRDALDGMVRQHEKSMIELLLESRGFVADGLRRKEDKEAKRSEVFDRIDSELLMTITMDVPLGMDALYRLAKLHCDSAEASSSASASASATGKLLDSFSFVAERLVRLAKGPGSLGTVLNSLHATYHDKEWWKAMNSVLEKHSTQK